MEERRTSGELVFKTSILGFADCRADVYRGEEQIAEKIPITTGGNDLPEALVYNRYNAGLRGTELLAPTPSDVIDYNDIKRMWGHKWKYAPHKRKPKKYKENLRWVYVGKA